MSRPWRKSEDRPRTPNCVPRILGVLLLPLFASVALAQVDSDGDGILDDGDASGSAFDCPCNSPCAPSTIVNCDDNCRQVPNPTQASDGSGVGDACNLAPREEPFELTNNQEIDEPRYRWKGDPEYLEKTLALVETSEPVGGGTCEFADITTFEGPTIGFTRPPIPPQGPYGGLSCCEWESRCSLGCANIEGAEANDCPAGTDCLIGFEIQDCTDALYGRCTGDNSVCADDTECTAGTCNLAAFVDPEDPEMDHDRLVAVGLALQDPSPTGACAAFLQGAPFAPCCFDFSRNVDYYWGTERLASGDPLLGQSLDGDLQPDVCDNCPFDANTDQADTDGDGCGDVCDNQPLISDPENCPEPSFPVALATAGWAMAAWARRRLQSSQI